MSKTSAQVKSELRAKGETISGWARRHGFPLSAVRAILSGHNKGHYGQSHKIAVALGIEGKQP
ncbi:MAG: DNA-binding protein [Pseudomonadota bacterium]